MTKRQAYPLSEYEAELRRQRRREQTRRLLGFAFAIFASLFLWALIVGVLSAFSGAPRATVRATSCETVIVHAPRPALLTMRALDGATVVQAETKRPNTRISQILPATTYDWTVRRGTSVAPGSLIAFGRVTVEGCWQ